MIFSPKTAHWGGLRRYPRFPPDLQWATRWRRQNGGRTRGEGDQSPGRTSSGRSDGNPMAIPTKMDMGCFIGFIFVSCWYMLMQEWWFTSANIGAHWICLGKSISKRRFSNREPRSVAPARCVFLLRFSSLAQFGRLFLNIHTSYLSNGDIVTYPCFLTIDLCFLTICRSFDTVGSSIPTGKHRTASLC